MGKVQVIVLLLMGVLLTANRTVVVTKDMIFASLRDTLIYYLLAKCTTRQIHDQIRLIVQREIIIKSGFRFCK